MCAVPNMAFFWGFLVFCFPGSIFGYFLSDFEIVFSCPYCHWYHFCYIIIIVIIIINFNKTWVYLVHPFTSILGFLLKCHLNVFSLDQTI